MPDFRLAVLFLPVAFSACCPGRAYQGDGHFTAKSCWPFPNYGVDFPLARPETATAWTYRFSGLPEMDSTAGFRLHSRSGTPCPQLERSELAKKMFGWCCGTRMATSSHK